MRLKLNRHFLTAVCIAASVAAALFDRPVQAVVVLPKGAKQPIMGYLVRQDERTIVIRQDLPGGKSRESSFPKKDLDELIITVSPERLAALDRNNLNDYREYAEELAEKQRDPEARDTAIRLYAIVAARGEGNLRHSALLGLIALARNADEERLFRAAAYLFDSDHDSSILAGSAAIADAGAFETSWSESLSKRGPAPLPALNLERLTEFDPGACVYRGGKWVRP
jgi:hypothetical protein